MMAVLLFGACGKNHAGYNTDNVNKSRSDPVQTTVITAP